jgi:hypothetical protein
MTADAALDAADIKQMVRERYGSAAVSSGSFRTSSRCSARPSVCCGRAAVWRSPMW